MDSICGGDLPEPAPHDGGINIYRICLNESDRVDDYQMNSSDFDWLRWIMDALDGKETSWLSKRNHPPEAFPILRVGNYKLDTRSLQLTGPRGITDLTPIQFKLLHYLMSHKGQVTSVNRLLQEVWDYPPETGSPYLVRVHIGKLRMKIEVDHTKPEFIKTIRGRGYVIHRARPPGREDG